MSTQKSIPAYTNIGWGRGRSIPKICWTTTKGWYRKLLIVSVSSFNLIYGPPSLKTHIIPIVAIKYIRRWLYVYLSITKAISIQSVSICCSSVVCFWLSVRDTNFSKSCKNKNKTSIKQTRLLWKNAYWVLGEGAVCHFQGKPKCGSLVFVIFM